MLFSGIFKKGDDAIYYIFAIFFNVFQWMDIEYMLARWKFFGNEGYLHDPLPRQRTRCTNTIQNTAKNT